MVDIKNLTVIHNGEALIRSADLKLRTGSIYRLSADTVSAGILLDVLAGRTLPASGEITVNGINMNKAPEKAKAQIGYLPSESPLFPDMTVSEYLYFIADAKHVKIGKILSQVRRLIEIFGISDIRDTLCRNISDDEKLRVGTAQAFIGNPDTVLIAADVSSLAHIVADLASDKAVVAVCRADSKLSKYCNVSLSIDGGILTAAENLPSFGGLSDGEITDSQEEVSE